MNTTRTAAVGVPSYLRSFGVIQAPRVAGVSLRVQEDAFHRMVALVRQPGGLIGVSFGELHRLAKSVMKYEEAKKASRTVGDTKAGAGAN